MDRSKQFAVQISSAIAACTNKESEFYIGEQLNDENVTDFTYAMLLSFCFILEDTTGEKRDILDAIALANRLAFQYGEVKRTTKDEK